jgi:CubicO group peptidase (beta-lactamase class C family)
VARITGQAIEPYMKANVFTPFGMTASGYVWNEEIAKRMARPHDRTGKPEENKKSKPADAARYGSSGALLTTPDDYAKFLLEVIDPKPADEFRLSAASLREMLRPQVKTDAYLYKSSWGLGWQIRHAENGDIIGHGGDNEGFHAACGASVARKSAYVVMTNGENGWELIQRRLAEDLVAHVL